VSNTSYVTVGALTHGDSGADEGLVFEKCGWVRGNGCRPALSRSRSGSRREGGPPKGAEASAKAPEVGPRLPPGSACDPVVGQAPVQGCVRAGLVRAARARALADAPSGGPSPRQRRDSPAERSAFPESEEGVCPHDASSRSPPHACTPACARGRCRCGYCGPRSGLSRARRAPP